MILLIEPMIRSGVRFRKDRRPVERPVHAVRLDHRPLRRLQSGDDRRRLHGRVGSADQKRRQARGGDRVHGAASVAGDSESHDQTSAG